jgi:arylsulfatase A-like enzyme/tetratricopeptide (TPR) repeat protein
MSRRFLAISMVAGLLLLGLIPAWRTLLPGWRERTIRGAPDRPDVLLLTLDTTRADRLGCYGGDPSATPVLDGLARRGVVFLRAYTHVPVTLPSHASLLTGATPAHHGVHDNGTFVLDGRFPTLAEAFARAGYRTGAFVSSVILDRRYGLARGFSQYSDQIDTGEGEEVLAQRPAGATVDQALAWLDRDSAVPVFAWVHLYDPHNPYTPPEPFASRFAGRPYDGEVAYMDAEIGRLLGVWASRKRPLLVAAVADHGESLGEHGEPTHAYFIYGATQHVPLILSFPGALPSGRQVEPLVRTVDLAPTLLEIARLALPDGLEGRSLVPLISGRSGTSPGPVYQESYIPRLWWGAREILGIRSGPWLYVRSPRPEIYNVEEDPAETVNLAAERPGEIERLGALLDGIVPPGDPLTGKTQIDAETARRLRALGYLGGSGEAVASPSEDLPDAKDIAGLLGPVADGQSFVENGDFAKALEAFHRAAETAPRSTVLRGWIARALLGLKRYDEAHEAYRELRDEHPGDEGYRIGMARARFRQGRKQDALALVREGLQAFPDSSGLHLNAGIILEDSRRLEEAEAAYRTAVELGPRDLQPRLFLATFYDRQGRLDDAASQHEAIVAASPSSRHGRHSAKRLATLGEALARERKLASARMAYLAATSAGTPEEAVFLNAALVCYQLGKRHESLELLRRGLGAFPKSADLHYRLARLLDEAGTRAEAEAEYRTALALSPGRSDVRYHLASLLEATGRVLEARDAYREVAADLGSRDSGRAREALERLRRRVTGG